MNLFCGERTGKVNMMNNTAVIKKIISPVLEKEGFCYAGTKTKLGDRHWLYKRQDGEWMQYIYIIKHRYFNQIWCGIVENKPEEDPWNDVIFELHYFNKEIKGNGAARIQYQDGESFVEALNVILKQIREYFLPGFKKLRVPRYWYCVTEDMEREVFERHTELSARLRKKYGMEVLKEDNIVSFLNSIVQEYQGKSIEEFKETFMELASCWGEFILQVYPDYYWDWDKQRKGCWIQDGDNKVVLQPLSTIFDTWQDEIGDVEKWYYLLFVENRKTEKAEKIYEMKKSKLSIKEAEHIEENIAPMLKQYGFRYESWQPYGYCWKFSREEGGEAQALSIVREDYGEMWVSGQTKKGSKIELADIREGLAPYDILELCKLYDAYQFQVVTERIKKQIQEDFLPVLDNEESYLLEYELTPEMRKREFFDREELLKQLKESYELDGIKKEEIPAFVKKVLQDNRGKTMEEFGDILLGLGIFLGETAIGEKQERHWLWDQAHSTCIVTHDHEIFGPDPAFALNYAWQREHYGNVDKLCKDLFDDESILWKEGLEK